MPPESIHADTLEESGHETDGVLVRPLGGQIYLVEEGDGTAPGVEAPARNRSPLSGLINRH